MCYKKGDDWWLVSATDIFKTLNAPRQEKLSEKRIVYYFDDIA